MSNKFKNVFTSIIGMGFLILSGYMLYADYDITKVSFGIFAAIGLIFYKSKLYNALKS